MKVLGIVDDKHTCDCCGKHPIKRAVALELDCGDVVFYGTTCATKKHLAQDTVPQLERAAKENKMAEIERLKPMIKDLPEYRSWVEKFNTAKALKLRPAQFGKYHKSEKLAMYKAAEKVINSSTNFSIHPQDFT